jgi:uncharacterized protein YndB with AHSA1/START domain
MPTAHPAEPEKEHAMSDAVSIRDEGPMIVATVLLPDCTPERALAAFTDPAILARWWRGELTASPLPDAPYTVDFPAIPATLTGQILTLKPGRFEFTWSWNEEPPDSTVLITAEPGLEPGSALMTVRHGPHDDDSAGRAAHQEHWDGWEYFLPRLVTALRIRARSSPAASA